MNEQLSISIKSEPDINYALYRCGNPIVESVQIENLTTEPTTGLRLVVRAENDEIGEFSCMLPSIPAHGSKKVSCKNIHPNVKALSTAGERYESTIYAEVYSGGALVASASSLINVDPIDRWIGDREPKTLAAFVLPDHPSLAPILSATKTALEKLGSSPCFNGYKDDDRNRVRTMVEASFHAMCNYGIAYSLAPAAFGHGQRIRLCKEVLGQKSGTCIDLSCAYVSLLESMRFNTILFISERHCWAGVWLIDTFSKQAVYKSPKTFIEQVKQGNALAIECTFFTKHNIQHCFGSHSSDHEPTTSELSALFSQALDKGLENLTKASDFCYGVDIANARRHCKIAPLPIAITDRMMRMGATRGITNPTETPMFKKTPGALGNHRKEPDSGKTPKRPNYTYTVPNYAASASAQRPNQSFIYNLVDISTSVGQEQVNTTMQHDIPNIIDAAASALDSDTACEYCLRTFSDSIETVIPPKEIRELTGKELPHVECRGRTFMMAEAVRSTIEEVIAKKNEIKRNKIQPSGAVIPIVTDGQYTDKNGYLISLPESLVNDIFLYNKYGQISTLAIGVGSDIDETILKQLGPDTEIKLDGKGILKDENGKPVTMKHAIRCKDEQGRKACWQAVVDLMAIRSSNLSKNLVFIYEDDAYQEWMDQVDIVALDPNQYEIL